MRLGLQIRNSGPTATRAVLGECARIADGIAGIDDLWVFDHIAVPPEESEGSDGIYVDPLATLAFLAGVTERVSLGTRVLILPYRPALPTAKWIASIQALSGGRLRIGAGIGWMEAEFAALGVDRAARGRIADETLGLIDRCFAADEVVENGQRFLFRPRPPRPPILVGGQPPHAFRRAVAFGDGWAAPRGDPDAIAGPAAELRALFGEAGKPPPEVLAPLNVDLDALDGLGARIAALGEAGVTGVAVNVRYTDAGAFRRVAETLADLAGTI